MFKQLTLLLLISHSLLQATAQPCSDTLLPGTAGCAALCCGRIVYNNNSIHIQASYPAQVVDSLPCYRFLLQPCDTAGLNNNPLPRNYFLNDSLLIKLPQQLLLVNDQPFTGSLRIAVYFYNRLVINGPFSGHNLHIFYFRDGHFLRQEEIRDIMLWHEHTRVRPA